MINVKIIGASGYGGLGLIELLLRHPEANISCLVAKEQVGAPISELYPHLKGYCDLPIVTNDCPEAQEAFDMVFLSTPDGVGMHLAQAELDRGAKVIDFSGDFRFDTPEAYAEYASRIGRDTTHASPELLNQTVYGVPELHRDLFTPDLKLVGNPGCFAVSCTLGLAPIAEAKLVRPGSMICDCKTGVSGAGKKLNAAFHFPQRYEQMNAYKLAGHQHVCEVERELGLLANEEMPITFTSQVVPMSRGIMSCLYGDLTQDLTEDDLIDIYRNFYGLDSFVQVLPSTAATGSMQVRATNRVNLVISTDSRNQRLRVVSYIDNLVKGQAGSAIQNMNLLFQLPENMGLDQPGIYP